MEGSIRVEAVTWATNAAVARRENFILGSYLLVDVPSAAEKKKKRNFIEMNAKRSNFLS